MRLWILLYLGFLFFVSLPDANAQTYSTVTIYYDGDSTVYGIANTGGTPVGDPHAYGHTVAGGTWSQQPDNIPARVQFIMQQAFGPVVFAENHGVGGETVLSSINGTGRYDCALNGNNETSTCGTLGDRLLASDAQIVVGHFLTNDQYRMTPEQFKQYWLVWIDTVRYRGKIPVLEESAPICQLPQPDVGPYLQAMYDAGVEASVMLMPQHNYIYENLDWIPMLADCVHPNNDIYTLIGNRSGTFMGRQVQLLLGR